MLFSATSVKRRSDPVYLDLHICGRHQLLAIKNIFSNALVIFDKMPLLQTSKRSIRQATILPVYDFLAPSLIQHHRASRSIRYLIASQRYCATARPQDPQILTPRTPKCVKEASSNPAPTCKPLTQAQRDFLTNAVRPLSIFPRPHLCPTYLLTSSSFASTKRAN